MSSNASLKLVLSLSIISGGKGCSDILPTAIFSKRCLRSMFCFLLRFASKSKSALKRICWSSIAMSLPGRRLRWMGHLPGEQRPAPSQKGFGMPLHKESMVCP